MHADTADGPTYVKYRYLDASALVKLYVDEPHSDTMRAFLNAHPKPFQTTSLCFAEAIGVLKRKWVRKQVADEHYLNMLHRLTIHVWGNVVQLQDYGLFDPFIQKEISRLVTTYHVDASDALQLLTIRHGIHSHMVDESASVLITGDDDLAKAARAEGIRVWNLNEGPAPDWA